MARSESEMFNTYGDKDWDAIYLIGRIAHKVQPKKGQSITARIDELIDLYNAAHLVKDPPPELQQALDNLHRTTSGDNDG